MVNKYDMGPELGLRQLCVSRYTFWVSPLRDVV